MIKLELKFISDLLEQPESGMGFQRVEVDRVGRVSARGVVINAELLVYDADALKELSEGLLAARLASAESSAGQIRSLRVINASPLGTAVREGSARSREAKDAPVEKTEAGQVFKRFSAFSHDRRVRADGSLLPGTYATTAEDALHVRSGSEAVARYALPNPEPASWVFTSNPLGATEIQRGIVAPANNQPGGGVEVIFPRGTQPGTTTGPTKIPD